MATDDPSDITRWELYKYGRSSKRGTVMWSGQQKTTSKRKTYLIEDGNEDSEMTQQVTHCSTLSKQVKVR